MSLTPKTRKLVEEWVGHQSTNTPLLASVIANDLRGKVDPLDVAEVLVALTTAGQLRRVYAVRVPSGSVLRRVYKSVKEIELEVRDPFNRPVSRDDLEVFPAFAKARG
jgi:hypothetical protein